MEKVGYITFHNALDSDHRAAFCDLNNTILDDDFDKNSQLEKYERLIGTNSTNNEGEKYIRYLNEYCEYHNIYSKIQSLYDLAHNTTTYDKENTLTLLNKIDTMITTAMLTSERKNCKKKQRTMWSPPLSESHLCVEFWNIVNKSYNQQIDSTERLQHILSRLPQETIDSFRSNELNYDEATTHAINKHKQNVKNHFELRKQHLQTIIDDLNDRS
jgi:hypothetical protein